MPSCISRTSWRSAAEDIRPGQRWEQQSCTALIVTLCFALNFGAVFRFPDRCALTHSLDTADVLVAALDQR